MNATVQPVSAHGVGGLLRDWRIARRWSQLKLGLEAGVSARHLSYLETGRAQPSREMICRLAEVLDVPLRERNALLLAAGFAPAFREMTLDEPALSRVRRALEFILAKHEPYPAFAVDRQWNLVKSNRASRAVFGLLLDGGVRHGNVMRQVFDPASLRPNIANWNEVADDLLRILRRDVAVSPHDAAARALLDEVLAYPGVAAHARAVRNANPLLTAVYRHGAEEVRFFSTITTFYTADELTASELRIECAFPADESTEAFCRRLANDIEPQH